MNICSKITEAHKALSRVREIVIATGSSAFIPPINGFDKTAFLTNETILPLFKRKK